MFARAGLPAAASIERIPDSRRALMLGELARESGRLEQLHPRLFDAYWARGLDISDTDVLVREGTAVGLDADAILQTLEQQVYLERIEQQTAEAIELGAGGVPAWLIDDRLLVPGAQPHEVFERVLVGLGHQPRP